MGKQWAEQLRSPRLQAMPGVLAVLSAVSGLVFPRTDALYGPAYIAAIVFALATPLAFLVVAPKSLFRQNRAFLWLYIATVVSAVCAAVTSGLLMSLGSPDGAAGDIGGFPMWLLSTGSLVTVSLLAIKAWHREQAGPATTLRDLQRQERRTKHR